MLAENGPRRGHDGAELATGQLLAPQALPQLVHRRVPVAHGAAALGANAEEALLVVLDREEVAAQQRLVDTVHWLSGRVLDDQTVEWAGTETGPDDSFTGSGTHLRSDMVAVPAGTLLPAVLAGHRFEVRELVATRLETLRVGSRAPAARRSPQRVPPTAGRRGHGVVVRGRRARLRSARAGTLYETAAMRWPPVVGRQEEPSFETFM